MHQLLVDTAIQFNRDGVDAIVYYYLFFIRIFVIRVVRSCLLRKFACVCLLRSSDMPSLLVKKSHRYLVINYSADSFDFGAIIKH
jgi:hypothetical protein